MNALLSRGYTLATRVSQLGNDPPKQNLTNANLQRIIEEMYMRQQQMEAELASTRAALNYTDADRRPTAPRATRPNKDTSTNALL